MGAWVFSLKKIRWRHALIKHGCFATRSALWALPLVLVATSAMAQKNKYACVEANPAQLCGVSNTCGSSGAPCTVDVVRTANSASAKPDLPNAKNGALFCVKVGTQVTFKSSDKNTGFLVDFGPVQAFDPDGAIIGGSAKDATVTAKTPGCYKFSAGACKSGAIYGMCQTTYGELAIIK
jgi:hypothetical protein